jgi:hypothetical protein
MIRGLTGLLPWVKPPRRGVGHAPPSRAEVKGIVELYLYSPLGLYRLFKGEICLLTFYDKCSCVDCFTLLIWFTKQNRISVKTNIMVIWGVNPRRFLGKY